MSAGIPKTIRLSEDRAHRLEQLASATGASEDAIIERALDVLFDLNDVDEAEKEREVWSTIGLPALERVWDNDADAVYDNWKELYGAPEG